MPSPHTATARPLARSQISLGGPTEVRDGWMVSLPAESTRRLPSGSAGRPATDPSAPLTLADASRLTKLAVRAAVTGRVAETLPRHGRAERDAHGTLLIGSGPGEWLLVSGQRSADDLAGDLPSSGEFVAAVDLSHGRAMLRLPGARATAVLAKLTAIDLRDEVVPNGAALRCSIASLVTDLVRDDHKGSPSFLLHCERSSGQYLFDVLAEAGQEFGLTPVSLWNDEL